MIRYRLSIAWAVAFFVLCELGGVALSQLPDPGRRDSSAGYRPGGGLTVSEAPPMKKSSPSPLEGVLAKGVSSDSPDCGANALYVFLQLHDVSCTLEGIRKEVPLTGQGASLLELKEAARRHGIEAIVIKVSPSELIDRLPAIARVVSAGSSDRAHYVVVTKATDDILGMIDGSSGVFIDASRPTFDHDFSGYALVAKSTWVNDGNQRKVNFFLAGLCGVEVLALSCLALYCLVRPLVLKTGSKGR